MFMDRSERDLMIAAKKDPLKFFSCNTKWPLCRFNFAREHVVTEEFVFKVENLADVEIF